MSVAVLLLLAVPAGAAAVEGGEGILGRDGVVGPNVVNGVPVTVQVGVSREPDVVAFAGSPTSAEDIEVEGGTPARLLLYRCGRFCATRYYFEPASGLLGVVSTTSRRFATAAGTAVGMSRAAAIRLEGRRPRQACGDGTEIVTGRSLYTIVGIDGRRVVGLALTSPDVGIGLC